jgi:hypothetical protein
MSVRKIIGSKQVSGYRYERWSERVSARSVGDKEKSLNRMKKGNRNRKSEEG